MAAVVSAMQKTRVVHLDMQSVVPLLLPYLLRSIGWCYSLGMTGLPLEEVTNDPPGTSGAAV